MFDIAFAATTSGPDFINSAYDLTDIIKVGIALVVLVSGLLTVFFILWGGVRLILSGGKDEKVKPAVNSIRFAALGIIIVIFSLFALPKLGDLLGLNVSQYVDPTEIFNTIQTLSAKFFGSSSDINLES